MREQVQKLHFCGSPLLMAPKIMHTSVYQIMINKNLSYRQGTTRCVVSVEILAVATQQCSTSPEQVEVMKLEG